MFENSRPTTPIARAAKAVREWFTPAPTIDPALREMRGEPTAPSARKSGWLFAKSPDAKTDAEELTVGKITYRNYPQEKTKHEVYAERRDEQINPKTGRANWFSPSDVMGGRRG